MPRKKKKEEVKKQRLVSLAKKDKKSIVKIDVESEFPMNEVEQNLEIEDYVKNNKIEDDEYIIIKNKNALQKEIESFKDPDMLAIPEFLTDPDMTIERKDAMDKIKYLLKHRFSLITITDILVTNNYSNLNEIIRQKNELFEAVEKYSKESGKPIKLFSGFKKVVGDEYSSTYAEQEKRMKAAIDILYNGTYFKSAEEEKEKVEDYIDNVIGAVVDHPDFNLACKIESEFIMHESDYAVNTLSDLRSRIELKGLIEELKEISTKTEERSHAYDVIDRLMTGKDRKIISQEDEQMNIPAEEPKSAEEGER